MWRKNRDFVDINKQMDGSLLFEAFETEDGL